MTSKAAAKSQTAQAKPRSWHIAQTAGEVRAVVLLVLETAILSVIGIWVLVGLAAHAKATGWALGGLLTMLHEQWRGAVILGVLVFYLTIREALDQLNLKSIKTPLGDFAVRPEDPLKPTKEDQK